RTSPGFWDYENNKSNVIKNLPAGTTGRIKDGPKKVDGIDFYDLEIDGFGSGRLQGQVLHTLDIKYAGGARAGVLGACRRRHVSPSSPRGLARRGGTVV